MTSRRSLSPFTRDRTPLTESDILTARLLKGICRGSPEKFRELPLRHSMGLLSVEPGHISRSGFLSFGLAVKGWRSTARA